MDPFYRYIKGASEGGSSSSELLQGLSRGAGLESCFEVRSVRVEGVRIEGTQGPLRQPLCDGLMGRSGPPWEGRAETDGNKGAAPRAQPPAVSSPPRSLPFPLRSAHCLPVVPTSAKHGHLRASTPAGPSVRTSCAPGLHRRPPLLGGGLCSIIQSQRWPRHALSPHLCVLNGPLLPGPHPEQDRAAVSAGPAPRGSPETPLIARMRE